MSDGRETAGLNDLEAALAALAPRPPALDRDAIMYRAGRSAVRRWQFATAISTIAAAVLAVALLVRTPGDRLANVSVPPPPAPVAEPPAPRESEPSPPSPEPNPSRYFHLQEQVLSHGLDGLPPLAAGPGPTDPINTEDLLHGL